MKDVYRGVVVIQAWGQDKYGNRIPAEKRLYTKPYGRKGTAAGQATRLATGYHHKVLDKYVEVAVVWQPA
jgi:hypothetical protein